MPVDGIKRYRLVNFCTCKKMTYFTLFACIFYLILNCLSQESKIQNGQLQKPQTCTDNATQRIGCCKKFESCLSIKTLEDHTNITMCSKKDNIVCCQGPCLSANVATSSPVIADQPSERISSTKCREYINNKVPENHLQLYRNRRNTNENFSTTTEFPDENILEIIGGIDAEVFEFPHMALIGWYDLNGNLTFKCGGSLISEKYVLTAGHCTSAPNLDLAQREPSVVRLREQHLRNNNQEKKEPIDIPIKKIIKHPNYKPPKKYFDIALIELNATVQFSSDVHPACLWMNNDLGNHNKGIVTGWGTTVSGVNQNSVILQKASVNFINGATCDTLLRSYHNRHWHGLQDHQLCAGVLEGGIDTCQGDSGGPIQVLDSIDGKRYYSVVGVTSFGRNCAKPDQPGIYSKVSKFVDWIESVVWSQSS